LPQAINVGKEIIDENYKDVANRIEFVPGDLVKDQFGADLMLYLCSTSFTTLTMMKISRRLRKFTMH
jgi:hypothetical protein